MTAVFLVAALALGRSEVDLDLLAHRYGLSRSTDVATGREVLRGPGVHLIVAPGLATALWNGEARALSAPVRLEGGRVVVPADVERLFIGRLPRRDPDPEPVARRLPERIPNFRVVIDPGHGGVHTGGKGRHGLLEKDVALDVSLRLARLLEEAGVEVVLTRSRDVHFAPDVDDDLQRRVAVANKARPDVFVSIHANWVASSEPRGWEVYVPKVLERSRASSRMLAQLIASEFRRLDTEERGIKEAGFRVLRGTDAPAVLVELEFISNPRGERELGDPEHRARLAGLLFGALRRYIAQR